MLTAFVARIIAFCTRHAWLALFAAVVLTALSALYSAGNFAINSDITRLLSDDIDWRQREVALQRAFPRLDTIVAVVEAPTPELVGQATAALAEALAKRTDRFRSVTQPPAASFFAANGLLFLPPDELRATLARLPAGEPLIADLAADQSLRGLVTTLENGLLGVNAGEITLDGMAPTLDRVSDAAEKILAGQPAAFSWRALSQGRPPEPRELRGFVDVRPILDFNAIEPGHLATAAIREAAAEIAPQYQARVRLTGPVAIADEEFATIKENAALNGVITVGIVIFILWLALHSWQLILAVFVNLFVGLAITAAVGLWMVGALNLISIYFAVLFVGIGVDFGIQYSVRYRAERHELEDLRSAVVAAGRHVAAPLTLAAGATAAGFLSFLPTAYKGVSELGLIAGVGMIIAFATSITVLPALIRLLNPPGEPAELGFRWLAPLDAFMERRRIPIIALTALVVIGGLPLLYWLKFDFNPVNLRSPSTESISTYLELARDPSSNTEAIQILTPSLAEADAKAARIAPLPEVARVMTLSSFVPSGQAEKIAMIGETAKVFAETFDPAKALPPPTDAEDVEALEEGAQRLVLAADDAAGGGPGATAARRLSAAMTALAKADEAVRDRAEAVFLPPLRLALGGLQASLAPRPITVAGLPPELIREWTTPEGLARVEIAPKESTQDNEAMRRFAQAVLAVEPNAIEGPISILKASDTIVGAFIQAGLWALVSIAILLWIVLRRVVDVLMTLIPLVLAGVVTLEASVLVDLPMNFANIIALPLLLGVGVAFKIYYIMAWRAGQTNLLQTPLTRAVVYSALTTATAFGSLFFSSHPGTSSMGELLALSLACTLFAAVLFQPLLMGKPRDIRPVEGN